MSNEFHSSAPLLKPDISFNVTQLVYRRPD
jgi:hypothetical protein